MWRKIGCGCVSFVAAVLVIVFVVLIMGIGSTHGGSNTPSPDPTKSAARKAGAAVGDGTYLVGKDFPAGTYVTPGPKSSDILDSCYWGRSKDATGDLTSVIANDNITGPGRVTVKTGEVFKISGGCEWHRA